MRKLNMRYGVLAALFLCSATGMGQAGSVSLLREKIQGFENKIAQAKKNNASPAAIKRLRKQGDFYRAALDFTEQRAYPNNSIDAEAYRQAVMMRSLIPPVPWANDQAIGAMSASGKWENVGPINTEVPYQQYYGVKPLSGRINAIAWDPVNLSKFYVATAGGGVWVTTDIGVTWTCLSNKWDMLTVSAIAIDPSNPNIIYVGTGDFNGGAPGLAINVPYSMGIMKSSDGGANWVNLGRADFGNYAVSDLAIDPGHPNIIIATVGRGSLSNTLLGGVFMSTTSGLTWTQAVPLGGFHYCDVDISEPFDDGERDYWVSGYGPVGGVVIRKRGDQTNWENVGHYPGAGWEGLATNSMYVACSRLDPNTAYVLSPGNNTIYKTFDEGYDWTDSTSNFPHGTLDNATYNWSQSMYDAHIQVGKATIGGIEKDIVYVGLIDIVQSMDGGLSWRTIGQSYAPTGAKTHNDQHCLAFRPDNDNIMLVGNDGGVYRLIYNPTNSGIAFTPLNKNLPAFHFYKGAWTANPARMMGGAQDNATPIATGDLANWKNRGGGDGGAGFILQNQLNTQFTTDTSWRTYRTFNNWTNWSQNDFNVSGDYRGWVWPMVPDPADITRAYFATNYLYSFNLSSWNTNDRIGNVDFAGGAPAHVKSIAVSSLDTNRIYVGTSNGKVWTTANRGLNWKDLTRSPLPNRAITDIWIEPASPHIVYVSVSGTGSGHVWQLSNANAALPVWTNRSGTGLTALPDAPINAIMRDPHDPLAMIAAGDLGIFWSPTHGTTWYNMGPPLGLPNVQINDIGFGNSATPYLYAATWGRGMWRLALQAPGNVTLDSISLLPTSVVGGLTSLITVNLNGLAPSPGVSVSLTSSNTLAATVPATVTIPTGSASRSFTVTSKSVATDINVTITATKGAVSKTAVLAVKAAKLYSITFTPTAFAGGLTNGTQGKVQLDGKPKTAAIVNLSSNNAVLTVPATVTVPITANFVLFTPTSNSTTVDKAVIVTATRAGVTKTATITVRAAAPASVTLSPTPVTGGSPSTGTVTLDVPAPAAGYAITLTSSLTTAATVPATLTFSALQTSKTFTVTTTPQTANKNVTITARRGSISKTVILPVLAPQLIAVSANPNSVTGGTSSTGKVEFNRNATANSSVLLSSNLTAYVQVPASAIIAINTTFKTFTITSSATTIQRTTTITATRAGITKTCTFTVMP